MTRLADAFQHGVNTLTRLMKHPAQMKKPAPGPVRFPEKPKATVTLSHNEVPGMKRWVRKITHYFPGTDKLGALNSGDFIQHALEVPGSKTFTLEDGLYETAQGPKSSLDSHLIRYHVKNGKIREIDAQEFNQNLKQLPFKSADEIVGKIRADIAAKQKPIDAQRRVVTEKKPFPILKKSRCNTQRLNPWSEIFHYILSAR